MARPNDKLPVNKEIGLNRITPSMLMTYNECPKLFYYRDWLGIKFPQDMRHMNFGTSIHEALDNIYSQYDNNFGGGWDGADFNKTVETFKRMWKKYLISKEEFERFAVTKKGFESGCKNANDLWKMMYDDGLLMLKDYWNEKEILLTDYGIDMEDTEIPVKMMMNNPTNPEESHPIPISMRIDGRTKDNVTVEFKTSGGRYNEEETRQKLQGRSYAFEGYQNYQHKNPRVVYIILLKNRKKDSRVQVIDLKYDESDMEMYYNEVGVILQKIANREFEAPLKDHKPYCQCGEYERMLKV